MGIPLAVDVSVGDSLETALDTIFDFLPKLVAALAILIVGYIIARIIRAVIVRVLGKAGLDSRLSAVKGSEHLTRLSPGGSVTRLLGGLVFWLLFIGVISLALTALDIEEVTDVVGAIYDYLPNVVAAIIIFIVAVLASGFATKMIRRFLGDRGMGSILAQVTPVLIMVIATFMILNQLRIASEIVTITYAAILGAIALAMALSFGLGGQRVAERVLDDAYAKNVDQRPSQDG